MVLSFFQFFQFGKKIRGINGAEVEFYISKGIRVHFIVIRKAINLGILQIHENIVRKFNTVLIGM